MTNNYYYNNIVEIMKEQGDWGVKIAKYDAKHGVPEKCEAQRSEFLKFVRDKSFKPDGTFKYVWNDGSVHDEPEE